MHTPIERLTLFLSLYVYINAQVLAKRERERKKERTECIHASVRVCQGEASWTADAQKREEKHDTVVYVVLCKNKSCVPGMVVLHSCAFTRARVKHQHFRARAALADDGGSPRRGESVYICAPPAHVTSNERKRERKREKAEEGRKRTSSSRRRHPVSCYFHVYYTFLPRALAPLSVRQNWFSLFRAHVQPRELACSVRARERKGQCSRSRGIRRNFP